MSNVARIARIIAMNNVYETRAINAAADNKAAQVGVVAGKTALVATAATAYVAVSALATFGWSKLGEKIWDAL